MDELTALLETDDPAADWLAAFWAANDASDARIAEYAAGLAAECGGDALDEGDGDAE